MRWVSVLWSHSQCSPCPAPRTSSLPLPLPLDLPLDFLSYSCKASQSSIRAEIILKPSSPLFKSLSLDSWETSLRRTRVEPGVWKRQEGLRCSLVSYLTFKLECGALNSKGKHHSIFTRTRSLELWKGGKVTFVGTWPPCHWQPLPTLQVFGMLVPMLKVKVKVLVAQSVWLFVTPWTVACQASLSMEFSRKEYWSA